MRFDRLRLLKYGNFDGRDLEFPPGEIDLQVIIGANEAGKSTTLAAVSDFLFGFPHNTDYDFRFDRQLLRVGAVVSAGGAPLSCRRRKGTKATLCDDADAPIDEGALAALLGGQSRDGFHRMFSLNHLRLREGGKAIVTASDDVGQAIFAAGSGLVGIARISQALDDEARAIWTKRASAERTYYIALRAYDEAKARYRDSQVKPAKWEELRKRVDRLAAELDGLRTKRDALRAELHIIERRRRTQTPIARMRAAEQAQAALGTVASLPADAADTLRRANAIAIAAEIQGKSATEQSAAAQSALAGITVNTLILANRTAIAAMQAAKGATDKSLDDIPLCCANIQSHQGTLAALLRQINWPELPADAVRARLPGRPVIEQVRQLLEDKSAVEAAARGAADELAAQQDDVVRLEREIAAAPPLVDIEPVKAALKLARDRGDPDLAVQEAQAADEASVSGLRGELAGLAPWTGDVEKLTDLGLPQDAAIKELAADLEGARKENESARAQAVYASEEHARCALQSEQMARDEEPVLPEHVGAARSARDALWTRIRARLLGGDEPAPSAESYETRVVAADGLADRRFAGAEQSGRFIEVKEKLELAMLDLTLRQERARLTAVALAQAQAAWDGAVGVVGPLSPVAFAAWLERRKQVLKAADAVRELSRRLACALARRDRVREAVRTVLAAAGSGVAELADAPVALLVAEAQALVEAAEKETQGRDAHHVLHRAAGDAAHRAGQKLEKAEAAVAIWESKWSPAVVAAGFDPAWEPQAMRAALNVLDDIRGKVDAIIDLQGRVKDMDADVAGFRRKVEALARQCGVEPDERSAADVIRDLAASVQEAARLSERWDGFEDQRLKAEQRMREAREQAGTAEAMLRPLRAEAGAATAADLGQAIERSDAARRGRTEIAALLAEIVAQGDGLDFAALLAESAQTDPAALKSQSDALQSDVKTLDGDVERAGVDLAAAQKLFAELDGRPDAAVAMADMAQARAEIEFQAEAYVRRRAEATLLRWAVERYRKEKQAPLLQRASELFATLTLGSYARLEVDTDANPAQLVGITADASTAIPVTKMSEGTVDQLYLALRLAAVEDAVDAGLKLPFLADDLFINFDDARAEAGCRVLAGLARKTQVLFFTHHKHLAALAQRAVSPAGLATCVLG